MSDQFPVKQKERLQSLLSEDRIKTTLQESAPESDPASLGAVAGVGYQAFQPDAQFSVYFFEDYSKIDGAVAKLLEIMPEEQPGVRVLYGRNGPLLFFGHARTDGEAGIEARFRLAKLISAFSGDE
jgi:hypothetical protein